jgi:hypothetical protein
MAQETPKCIYCERSDNEIPLIAMRSQKQEIWICPEHLPILIHKPAQLVDKLPGAAHLSPPEEHDH